jgi:hypothetical protein
LTSFSINPSTIGSSGDSMKRRDALRSLSMAGGASLLSMRKDHMPLPV